MDLYEYQGKRYLARFGIPVGRGTIADTVEAAVAAADELGYPVVLKAQVKTGGRGKAGGVRVAADPAEAASYAEAILGLVIKGHTVRRLWVETAAEIAHEYYVGFTLDRAAKLLSRRKTRGRSRGSRSTRSTGSRRTTRRRSPRPPGSMPRRERESPT